LKTLEQTFKDVFYCDSKPFQIQVATHLLSGKNVILRAPTGSGKTFAALFPFLYACMECKQGAMFPRQMIYSLPLRVLANSLAATAKKTSPSQEIRVQTGETPLDGQFLEGDQIYTSYDQTLSSFLHFPFSLGSRQANVNAGALISSYLVFDEVHLMEMHRALATTAEILCWLKETTPFLMMTATLTDSSINWLCERTGAVVVELSEEEIKALAKPRQWILEERPIHAELIAQHHTGKTIAVVNQVARAQELYRQLQDIKRENERFSNTYIELLHSRFTQTHRNRKSEKIERWFGKKCDDTDCILVSTQVIEVGLDISCTRMHTELAPSNALVQRAGRCARFQGSGEVHVYPLPDESKPFLPYDDAMCTATLKQFGIVNAAEASGNFVQVGYEEELAFVKAVHEEVDKASIEQVILDRRDQKIKETILSEEGYKNYRPLVRDIDAVSVFICRDPKTKKIRPFTHDAFSISPHTLMGALKKADSGSEPFGWYPEEGIDNGLEDEATAWQTTYTWRPLNVQDDICKAQQIALNPAYAKYDELLGLQLNMKGGWESPALNRQAATERYTYSRETYEQHIRKVWQCYEHRFADKHRLAYVSKRHEDALNIPAGTVALLIQLVIACHDAAKLTKGWQDQINAYQREIGMSVADRDEFLAHSDFEPDNADHNKANKKYKRPHHAVEGAIITVGAVFDSAFIDLPTTTRSQLAKAFFAAISRHHSPRSTQCTEQMLAPGARKEIGALVQRISGHNLGTKAMQKLLEQTLSESIERYIPNPLNFAEQTTYLLYLTLVRALRISDQHSFEEVL